MTSDAASRVARWQAVAVMYWQPAVALVQHGELATIPSGWLLDIEGNEPKDWEAFARSLLLGDAPPTSAYLLQNNAATPGTYCAAAFLDDCLVGALLVASPPLQLDRRWLTARLGTPLDAGERFRLLDGRPSGALTPRTSVVCVCCQIGDTEIVEAIAAGRSTIAAIGAATRAGTNCGRCRPRIAALIEGAASTGGG